SGRTAVDDGFGGNGGGAVQLSVGGTLTMLPYSTVAAFGGGGLGGTGGQRIAGGGGGSGGAVLLEANLLSLAALSAVTANGGAGGEGSGDVITGGDGDDGYPRLTLRATCNDNGYGGNGG